MSRWNNKAGNLKAKHFWANLKLVASPMFTGHSWTVMRTCHADKIVKKAINVSCAHGSCGGSAAILLISSSSNEAGAADHWTWRWYLRRRNFETHHITNTPNMFDHLHHNSLTGWQGDLQMYLKKFSGLGRASRHDSHPYFINNCRLTCGNMYGRKQAESVWTKLMYE